VPGTSRRHTRRGDRRRQQQAVGGEHKKSVLARRCRAIVLTVVQNRMNEHRRPIEEKP
jgi:hypothetical protein